MSGILYTEEGVIENGTIRFRMRTCIGWRPTNSCGVALCRYPKGGAYFRR